MKKVHNVTVLGDGAFGTAFATLLAHNGHKVTLWCYNPEVAAEIQTHHCNSKFLPDISLSKSIHATTSLQEALKNTIIFEAIPVQFMRSIFEQCRAYARPEHRWIVLSKGIENNTLLLPTEVIRNTIAKDAVTGVVTGPSYARDLAHQQPTGLCVATHTKELNDEIIQLLKNDFIYCEPSDNVIGAQIVAAVKNVIALAIGLVEGAGYQANTQALLLMRAYEEQKKVLNLVQAEESILYGLAGMGDLVLTCFGTKSRNHSVGIMLGQRKKLDVILKETGYIPEGINTLQSLQQLTQKTDLTLPLFTHLYEIIFNNGNITTFVENLSK